MTSRTRTTGRRGGLTLVEVLVVIGVIAVLVAVLLPALSRAGRQAKLAVDLSNGRQLATAALAFRDDYGVLPTASSADAVAMADGSEAYPTTTRAGAEGWVDSLSRYLGGDAAGVFRCPSDPAVLAGGHKLPADADGPGVAVSYGMNVDLTAVTATVEGLRWTLVAADAPVGVYASDNPYPGERYHGTGAAGRLVRVSEASRTLLFADAATDRRPPAGGETPPLDRPDVLAHTTHFTAYNDADPSGWGRLSGALQTPWLATRLPLARHDADGLDAAGNLPTSPLPPQGRGGVLPVTFADGHAEAVGRAGFARVKVTPFALTPTPRPHPATAGALEVP